MGSTATATECTLGTYLCLASAHSELLGLVGAAIAFAFALWQYAKAQKWKRNEFLAREIKEFNQSPAVGKAVAVLDWYGRLVDLDADDDSRKVWVVHSTARQGTAPEYKDRNGRVRKREEVILERALQFHEDREAENRSEQVGSLCKFSPGEQEMRDCFDRLFYYFERFESLLDNRLFSIDAIRPYVEYNVSLINGMRQHSDDYQKSLFTFLVMYDYERAIDFLARFPQRSDIQGYIDEARERKDELREDWVRDLRKRRPPVTLPEAHLSCFFS